MGETRGRAFAPPNLDERVITLPKLEDWAVDLGHLWNCNKNTHLPQALFRIDELVKRDHVIVVPSPETTYTLSRVRDAEGKSSLLDLSLEVKLTLPAGPNTIKLEGGIKFSKDEVRKSDEEEFFCQYDTTTSIVKVRNSVVEDPRVFIPSVVEDIMAGHIDATHYVSEIRYGGAATASFSLSDNLSHDHLVLGGHIGGLIPVFAGIDVGIKASLNMMEKEREESFSKRIKAEIRPPIIIPAPTTIEEMFEFVENMPKAIHQSTPPYADIPRVKGTPITFKLSPLSQLKIPRAPESPLTRVLSPETLQGAVEAMFSLSEFDLDPDTQFSKLRSRLREENHILPIFFAPPTPTNPASYNPFAVKIFQEEKELIAIAADLMTRLRAVIEEFNKAESPIREVDVIAVIDEFKASRVGPTALQASVLAYAKDGRDILVPLKLSDATLAGDPALFVFNGDDWADLYMGGTRILFATGADLPHNSLITLYRMTPILGSDVLSVPIKVRVSAPNIVEFTRLDFVTNNGDYDVHRFSGGEVLVALDVFQLVVDSIRRRHTIASRLRTASNLQGQRLETWDLVNSFQTNLTLVKELREGRSVCESYLQTVEAIMTVTSEEDMTFLLTPQFTTSLLSATSGFNRVVRKMGSRSFGTIAGVFDNFAEGQPSPILTVLKRGGSVGSVLFDKLDTLLYISGDPKGLDALSPGNVARYPLFPRAQGETALELIKILEGRVLPVRFKPSPFELREEDQNLSAWREAMAVITASVFATREAFVHSVAGPIAPLLGGPVTSVFKAKGWTEGTGFDRPEVPTDDWSSLKTSVESYKNEPTTDPSLLPLLEVLSVTLSYAGGESGGVLRLICTFFVNQFIERSEIHGPGSEFDSEIRGKLDAIQNDKINGILEVLETLQVAGMNANYFKLWLKLQAINLDMEPTTASTITSVLEVLALFTHKEKEWVWSNQKFRAWVALFYQSKSVLAKIFKLFCQPTTTSPPPYQLDQLIESIPSYIPADLSQLLVPLAMTAGEPHVLWEEEWKDVEDMLDAFHTLIVKDIVPNNFTQVLLKNISARDQLKVALDAKDVLFFWGQNEGLFSTAWGLGEIEKAFDAFDKSSEIPKSTTLLTLCEKPKSPETKLPLKLRTDTWLDVTDEKWRLLTGPKMKGISMDDFFLAPLLTRPLPPLVLYTKEALKESWNKDLFTFLIYHVRQGSIWASSIPSRTLLYIDYPDMSRDLPRIQKGEEPNSLDEQSRLGWMMDQLSTFLSPIQTLACVGPYMALANDDDHENQLSERSAGQPFFLSASDILVGLLTSSLPGGPCATAEILQRLVKPRNMDVSGHIRALPWHIPRITLSTVHGTDLTNALTLVQIQDEGIPRQPCTIFEPPFKLVTAIRLGTKPYPFGKSSLLNEAILRTFHFSSRREEGALNGHPLRREGLVELTWLSKGSVKEGFWQEVLDTYYNGKYSREPAFLANMHGDAASQTELLEKLTPFTGTFLIFWSVSTIREYKNILEEITPLIEGRQVYHMFIEPSPELVSEVPGESILSYDEDFEGRLTSAFGKLLNDCPAHFVADGRPLSSGQRLFELVRNNSVQSVKTALVKGEGSLREVVLMQFIQMLNQADALEEVWTFSLLLQRLVEDTASDSQNIMQGVASNLLSYRDTMDPSGLAPTAAAALAAESLFFNQLSILDFFQGLMTFVVDPTEFTDLVGPFVSVGLPLPFLDHSLEINPKVEAIFDSNLRFLTLSALGFYGCGKKGVLDDLFMRPGFLRTSSSLPGVTMTFLPFDPSTKATFGDAYDALLLLDVEDFGRPETLLRSGNAVSREGQLTTFLASISDALLFFTNGQFESIQQERLLNIVGQLSLQSAISGRSVGADITFITHKKSQRALDVPLLQLLQSTAGLAEENVIHLKPRVALHDALTSFYHGIFSGTLEHQFRSGEEASLQKLRDSIFHGLQSRVLFPSSVKKTSEWMESAKVVWGTLEEVWRNQRDAPGMIQVREKWMGEIERALEIHEEIVDEGRMEKWTSDFSTLNGLPYFCVYRSEEVPPCECENVEENIQDHLEALNEVSTEQERDLILESFEDHSVQVWADCVTHLTQEGATMELSIPVGMPDGILHAKLEEMMADGLQGPQLLLEFKRLVASKIGVIPWTDVLRAEVKSVYGEELANLVSTKAPLSFEELAFTSYESSLQWGLGPQEFDERKFALQGLMVWEEYLWLEMEVEREVRTSVIGSRGRYRRGNVRRLRDGVEDILREGFRDRMPSELAFLPSFIVDVHVLALTSFLAAWGKEWEGYQKKWNPLVALEERIDFFPERLFDPEAE